MFYPTLFEAIEKKDVDDVILHINSGCNVNETDLQGNTPLHAAVRLKNEEIIELLIEANVDVDLKNNYEESAVEYAVNDGSLNIVKKLIDAGADVNCSSPDRNSLLYNAVTRQDFSMAKLLVTSGADVNTKICKYLSIASIAFRRELFDMVELLLEAGADINSLSNPYCTALHYAAAENKLSSIKFLLSHGVDINTKNNYSQSALHLAVNKSQRDSHFEIVEYLVKNGADINCKDDSKNSPLHSVVGGSNIEILKLFLNRIVSINGHAADSINTDINDDGKNPFINAISYTQNMELIELLVSHGSDVNYVNPKNGLTSLHYVYESGKKIIKYLLKNGAKLEALDFKGSTPLLSGLNSAKPGYETSYFIENLIFFLNYANVNAIDSNGQNILTNLDSSGNKWKIILEHLAKLQVLELSVLPSIFNAISSNAEFNYYFNKCTKELSLAKNTKLHNSWVTYFNLLVDSKRKLKNYAGNQDLVQDFDKCNLKKTFRIYGDSMRKNMKKGIERRQLFDKSVVLLSKLLPIYHPTHLIIRDVTDCLTSKDLSKFNQ